MALLWVYTFLIYSPIFLLTSSQEVTTENLKTVTQESGNLDIVVTNTTFLETGNETTVSHLTTPSHPTTTKRSTTLRTTRSTTPRTTRTTTKRTTTVRTTFHRAAVTSQPINNTETYSETHSETAVTHPNVVRPLTANILDSNNDTKTSNYSQNLNNSVTEVVYDDYSYDANDTLDDSVAENTVKPSRQEDRQNPSEKKTILEVINDLGMTAFIDLMKKVGMEKLLTDAGPYTVFLPSDKALLSLPFFLDKILFDKSERMKTFLQYHIVKGGIHSTQMKNDDLLPTLYEGKYIRINIYPAAQTKKLITANGSPISFANFQASNGLIHIIERFLFKIPDVDILEALKSNPKFSTISKALETVKFGDVLKDGTFTMFAPTENAFKKIPEDERHSLLNNKDDLESLLKVHTVPGVHFFPSLKNIPELQTLLNAAPLKFSSKDSVMKINDKALLTEVDIPVLNGVIHVIDTVLFPTIPQRHRSVPPVDNID